MTAKEIIDKLKLAPHPEGGYYRETYRSKHELPANSLQEYTGARNYCTAIYFLLTKDCYSAFHRVKQDELWHFHSGNPIELHHISPNGKYQKVLIGNDLSRDARPQFTVPGGHWFAARVIPNGDYGLVSCTVAPGFDFADFELASKELIKKFPMHANIIEQLLPTEDS